MLIEFLALLASLMISYSGDKYLASYGVPYISPSIKIPMEREIRLFIIFVFSLLNMPFLALVVIAVMGNLEVLRRLITVKVSHGL
ncbi:MAG TPA: hypothetical protein ENG22_02230 [Candidatus Bathyarchaeota archaeon]|nr:hypothetical protein [Candidatus Bathyarchaeota archaeon]